MPTEFIQLTLTLTKKKINEFLLLSHFWQDAVAWRVLFEALDDCGCV